MVSTNSSQYATDFNNSPTAVDTTKSSPLSLLAKTCEAIGLPDTPSSKKTPKKDENSPGDVKKSDSPNLSKRKDGLRSPRATPKLTDPAAALTAMGLHKGASGMFSPFGLPMGFPMGFPGMLPYPPMPYPSFPIPPFMRCPSLMMGRPCTNPAICTACSSVSGSTDAATLSALAAASTFPGMPPFAYPFMPSTSTAASLPATYQQMLQAAAAASVSSSSLPVTTALPASIPTPSTVSSTVSTPSPVSIKCQWSSCGKTFTTAEELDVHFKAAHNPSPRSSVKSPISLSSTVSSTSTPSNPSSSSSTTSTRYHPYSKPSISSNPPVSSSISSPMPAFPFAGISSFPAALSAMYQQHQRLLGMTHP